MVKPIRIVALYGIVLLTLCGGLAFSGGTQESGSQAPAAKSKVVLWMAGDEARWFQESDLISKFQAAYPQYTIEETNYPWDAQHDKLVAGFASGVEPDIAWAADQWVGEFAAVGGLASLDSFIKTKGYQDSDFLPTSWSHFRYKDGKIYAAPSVFEARVLFYRTDLFQEAGIDGPPKTLDELMSIGEKLSNGNDRFGLSHQDQWLDFHFFSWLVYAMGGDFYNADGTASTLTSPAVMEALNYYKSLYDNDVIPKDPAKRVEAFKGFKEGYYAMAESGGWWLGLLDKQAPELKGKWAVAVLPSGKTTVSYGHPNALLLPAAAKNKPGAEAFISFWLSAPTQAEWFTISGQMPVLLAAFNDPRLASNSVLQVFRESAQRGTNSIHNVPNGDPITQVIWNMLAQVRDGMKSPADAAAEASQKMNALLKP